MTSERVSVAEAAARLQVSELAVRRWIESGKLAAELGRCPSGQQYWLSPETIEAAERVLRIVKIARRTDARPTVLAAEPQEVSLEAELARVRREMAELYDELELRRRFA